MADTPLVWDDLARYKAEGRFLDGYPDDQRTFFAPRDNVHGLLAALLGSAQHSIVVNMFGYWSLSGEQQQDNELTLSRNAVVAAETRAILDLNHDFMLKQMVGTKLDVTKLQAPAASAAMPPLPPAPAA
jgi:hypothetical protein